MQTSFLGGKRAITVSFHDSVIFAATCFVSVLWVLPFSTFCFPSNQLTKNSINIEVALSFLWQLFHCWTLLENGKYTSNLRIILMSYFAPTFPFAKFGNFQHWKSCQLFVNDLTGKVTSAPTLTTSSPYLMTLEVAPSHLGCIPYYPSFLLLTFSFLVQLNVHQLHLRILLPISPSYSVAARRIDCAGLSNSTI